MSNEVEIVVMCTANINRSPMGEGLLRREVALRGLDDVVSVSSAGVLEGGRRAADPAIAAVDALGVDISTHVSRTITPAMVASATLVLCMAREHLRHAAVLAPGAFTKTFTYKEFARRGIDRPFEAGESFDSWLDRLSADRDPAELFGEDPSDDVEDPIGQGFEKFESAAAEIDGLSRQIGTLLFGPPAG